MRAPRPPGPSRPGWRTGLLRLHDAATPALGTLLTAGLLLLLLAAPGSAQAVLQPLSIATSAGPQRFQVEFVDTDRDRAQGLMYRRSLAPDRGMLFDFGRVEPISMWMQNTYVPLDMLFIRPDGTIARVAENAEPLSTAVIPSGEPVLAVLEVVAGTARRLGIRPGDRVEHAMFRR